MTLASSMFRFTFFNKSLLLVFRRRKQHDYRLLILLDHGPREKSRACTERKIRIHAIRPDTCTLNSTNNRGHTWHTGEGVGLVTGGWPVRILRKSTDEVPLSKASETPTCSPGAAPRQPTAPVVPVCPHVCNCMCVPVCAPVFVYPTCVDLCVCMCSPATRMGQMQRKNFPLKRDE